MKLFFFLSALSALVTPLLNKVDKVWLGLLLTMIFFILALFFSKPRFTKG